MLFLVNFSYYEESPRGGSGRNITETKCVHVKDEEELVTYINIFQSTDKGGYRKNIKLLDVKRI